MDEVCGDWRGFVLPNIDKDRIVFIPIIVVEIHSRSY